MVDWEEKKYPFAAVNFAICKNSYAFSIMLCPFMGNNFFLLYKGLPTGHRFFGLEVDGSQYHLLI